MFSAIGLATARRVRFGGALPASSRLYLNAGTRSAVVIPTGFRLDAAFQKGFAQARTGASASKTASKTATTKASSSKTSASSASKSKAAPAKAKATTSKATASKSTKSTASSSTSKPKAKAAASKKVTKQKVKTAAALRREKAAIAARAKREKQAAADKAKKAAKAAAAKAKREKDKALAKEKKEKAAIVKKEKAALAKEKKKVVLVKRREKAAAIAARRKERKAIAAKKAKEKRAAAAAKQKARANSPKAQKKRQIEKIKELRKTALLEEVPRAPITGWSIYAGKHLSDIIKEVKASGQEQKTAFNILSERFHRLPADEVETLRLQARQNYLANDVAYKAWVASHSPIAIREANKARQVLKQLGVKSKPTIHDPRQPKPPVTSFIQFFSERMKSGHYENVPQKQMASSAGAEWRSLNDAARKPYIQAAKLDSDRYHREVKALEESSATL